MLDIFHRANQILKFSYEVPKEKVELWLWLNKNTKLLTFHAIPSYFYES